MKLLLCSAIINRRAFLRTAPEKSVARPPARLRAQIRNASLPKEPAERRFLLTIDNGCGYIKKPLQNNGGFGDMF